jgi:acetylornithine/succinyldiaminopimelate/putrescine aminotransferase
MTSLLAVHPSNTQIKPGLSGAQCALGLDVEYERASGDTLYWRDSHGHSHSAVDFVGGRGSFLFGHNHPAVVDAARELLNAQVPVHAQFSMSGRSVLLAQRLGAIATRETGGHFSFVTAFASSSAEALEAAIQHAELERSQRLSASLDDIDRHIDDARAAIRRGEAELVPGMYGFLGTHEQVFDVQDFDALVVALLHHNAQQVAKRPVFLALEKSAHESLASGNSPTSQNRKIRRPFGYLGLTLRLVPMNDATALESIVAQERAELFDLSLEGGKVLVRPREFPVFAAFLVEPIQSQAGLHSVEPVFAQSIRRFCNQQGIPLVVDESQSGMGRSGSFFASAQVGLKGDCYILSKALGGGLAKISALLIRKERYRSEFAGLAGLPFADDELAAGIALVVLDLLEADNGAAYRRAEQLGAVLLERLLGLKAQYPHLIHAVRGRGLLLGLEFAPLDTAESQIFRTVDHTESLGHLLSGCCTPQACGWRQAAVRTGCFVWSHRC